MAPAEERGDGDGDGENLYHEGLGLMVGFLGKPH